MDDKDLTGRLVLTPFLHSVSFPALKKLSFGGSFGTGNNKQDLSGFDLKTEATTTFLDIQSGVNQDGRLNRWGLELDYAFGSFGLKGEYLKGRYDDVLKGTAKTYYEQRGAYLTTGYILSGEDWALNAKRNFDPARGA